MPLAFRPEGLRYVEFLKTSARKMQDLIDALLALSRMGRSPVHTSTVDAMQLVREVLDDLQPEFEGRVIDLHVGYCCRRSPWIQP